MIAYFVHNLDSYSGAAQQALLLAKHIDKKILIFNHNGKVFNEKKYDKNIIIVDLPSSNLIQLLVILFYTIKKDIKIYHLHGSFNIALLISSFLNIKVILKTTLLGDDDFKTLSQKKHWKLRKFFLQNVYKNIVLSSELKRINSQFIDKSKIELIPNGVLLSKKCPKLNEKKDLFCFVGLVCERKRTFESIKYFIDNYSEDLDTKMYIVGPYQNVQNIPEFQESYVQKCIELIEDHNLSDRIIFKGRLSREDTQDIFRSCKALLFFSDKEGMPNVVLEAMANNCIPITSEIDGVASEIFEHRKQGFILTRNIEKVSMQFIDRLIAKKAPYLRIQEHFEISMIANKYIELYEH